MKVLRLAVALYRILNVCARYETANFVSDVGRKLTIRRSIADQQQVSIRRPSDLQILEHHRRFQARRGFVDSLFQSVLLHLAQVVLVDNRPHHGIRLDQLHLSSQKLIRVIGGVLQSLLTQNPGRHLAIDVDSGGRFVNRSQPQGNHESSQHRPNDKRPDLPTMPPQNPQVVRKRKMRRLRLIFGINRRRALRCNPIGFLNRR